MLAHGPNEGFLNDGSHKLPLDRVEVSPGEASGSESGGTVLMVEKPVVRTQGLVEPDGVIETCEHEGAERSHAAMGLQDAINQ